MLVFETSRCVPLMSTRILRRQDTVAVRDGDESLLTCHCVHRMHRRLGRSLNNHQRMAL